MLNFEVASFISFRDTQKNHFVMAAEADINGSIKQTCIHVLRENRCKKILSAYVLVEKNT